MAERTDAVILDLKRTGSNPAIRITNSAAASGADVSIEGSISAATFTGDMTSTASTITTLTATDINLGNDLTVAEAGNIILGTTTGTKIGTAATQKLGFFNKAPVVQPTAYTQTFATADKTHAARTAVATATTAATSTSPFGYAEAQANAIITNLNALVVDVADTAALLNSLIDDLQALGLIA